MKSARVRNLGAVHSTLRRLPTTGKVRAGIKVLTAKAAAVNGLQKIYDDGVNHGDSFDAIERRLKAVKGCPNYPLAPRNVPYFRVVQEDFSTPGAAALIMDTYAEVRDPDPIPRLYSLPVVFPSDDIDMVFRETFEAWSGNELMHWSEPDPQTGDLMCMRRKVVEPKAKRGKVWGGRPTESAGPCSPNECELFAAGQCRHIGSMYFWVPGIPGVGLIELQFYSIYASMDVVEKLDLVHSGLGHIRGLHDGKPIFRLSKTHDNVARMDWNTGKASRTDQWIIRLEADLDMVSVISGEEQSKLEAPAEVQRLVAPAREEVPAREEIPTEEEAQLGDIEPDPEPEPAQDETSEPESNEPDLGALREKLNELRIARGWSPSELLDWADGEDYSKGATQNPALVAEMIEKLEALPPEEPKGDDEPQEDIPF